MIFEKYEKHPGGGFIRRVEVQTELAEWEQVDGHAWRRKVKEWNT